MTFIPNRIVYSICIKILLSLTLLVTSLRFGKRNEMCMMTIRSPKNLPTPVFAEISSIQTPLLEPIGFLKGVGPGLGNKLKNLKIHTMMDLLLHFPSGVVDRNIKGSILDVTEGMIATLELTCDKIFDGSKPTMPKIVKCYDGVGNAISIVHWLGKHSYAHSQWAVMKKTVYIPGSKIIVSGKLSKLKKTAAFEIVNPDIFISRSSYDANDQKDPTFDFEPVYPLTEGLTQSKVRSLIANVLALVESDDLYSADWMT